ncbi:MAG: hypothetical protein PHF00_10635, partial [Elusimicrobia bacterium]|nr:hypothetical protein [Elusimicrobiota bacterium]
DVLQNWLMLNLPIAVLAMIALAVANYTADYGYGPGDTTVQSWGSRNRIFTIWPVVTLIMSAALMLNAFPLLSATGLAAMLNLANSALIYRWVDRALKYPYELKKGPFWLGGTLGVVFGILGAVLLQPVGALILLPIIISTLLLLTNQP